MSTVNRTVPPEQLGRALSDILMGWAENEEKKFVQAIDDAAQACSDTAGQGQYLYKGHGLRTGQYRNSFAICKEWKGRHDYSATWHVEAPNYRLTHLLENGHAIVDGTGRVVGKSPAIKHIKYGRQIAEQVLDEKLQGLWGG